MPTPFASTLLRSSRLGLICLLAASSARAEIFRVGVGTGCTHATLESAFAAAEANGPVADSIYIAVPSLVLASRIEILNDEVAAIGGFSSCTAPVVTGRTTISFDSPSEAFWVHGSSASQLNLRSVDVELGSSAGRAATVEGHGTLFLETATLSGGQAPSGGNVWISGIDASLWMIEGSEIKFGTATSGDGGGIYCELGAFLVLRESSKFSDNTASGSGGGLFIDGCEVQFDQFVSGTPPGSAEISRNKATTGNGGGLAVVGNASVGLTGWPAAGAPLFVSDNEAVLGSGGGIAFDGSTGGAGLGLLCGEVSGNSAGQTGGGIYVTGTGSIEMTTDPLPCPTGRGSSVLRDNRSGSFGGGIFVDGPDNVEAVVTRTSIFGNWNTAATSGAAAAIKGSASLRLESCEIYDNEPPPASGGVETPRIYAGGTGAGLTVAYSTVVEQTTAPGTAALQYDGAASIVLVSSIVQASKTFTAQPPATQVDCVIVAESASLPLSASAVSVVTDPALLFRLATAADFALRRGSPAQDYCDTMIYPPLTTDIDGEDRGFDDMTLAHLWGPYDLGADEWRPEILADGFESGDSTHWSSIAP